MNSAERLLNDAADYIAATLEQPADTRAWTHLLIYCPKELIIQRAQALASLEGDAVERVAGLLRKFHRDSCYPEAMAGELNAAVNAVLATGPVAGEAAIRADEREKCARIAGSECYATTGRQIAAAIRSEDVA